ncbi:hypothetical protein HUF15_43600 [Streptomyces samsunensis]|uniref:hypothetical protein n=1 Tax=Streptomyces malaysiensis TaxID=92644 RepID=UPI0015837046|nr:hypothetical protein [Streptomyces samsunensis]NUH43506.1 hypothetical protein [Streptomyces samsunensis]
MKARRATSVDARELVRLRHVMFTSLGPTPSDETWLRRCQGAFAERLEHDPSFAAFVIGVPSSGPLLSALLQWLAEHDCSHVQLRASAEGHALYEQLGFNTVDDAHMVWMPPTA